MKRKPLMTQADVRKTIADGWKPAIHGWKTKAGAKKIAEVDFTKKLSKTTMQGFCFMHVDGLTQGQLRELVDHVKEAQPNCKINFV